MQQIQSCAVISASTGVSWPSGLLRSGSQAVGIAKSAQADWFQPAAAGFAEAAGDFPSPETVERIDPVVAVLNHCFLRRSYGIMSARDRVRQSAPPTIVDSMIPLSSLCVHDAAMLGLGGKHEGPGTAPAAIAGAHSGG